MAFPIRATCCPILAHPNRQAPRARDQAGADHRDVASAPREQASRDGPEGEHRGRLQHVRGAISGALEEEAWPADCSPAEKLKGVRGWSTSFGPPEPSSNLLNSAGRLRTALRSFIVRTRKIAGRPPLCPASKSVSQSVRIPPGSGSSRRSTVDETPFIAVCGERGLPGKPNS